MALPGIRYGKYPEWGPDGFEGSEGAANKSLPAQSGPENMTQHYITISTEDRQTINHRLPKDRHMKLLILGNSITRHSPSPEIGWTGDWGMAASAKEKDFAHILAGMLEKRGRHVKLRARNVADFERDPSLDLSAYFAEDIAFCPNAVVLRICENTPEGSAEAFAEAYEKLILLLKRDPACRVFAVGPFWENERMETLIREAAERTGAVWLSLSHLQNSAYRAIGLFQHEGIAAHPSDTGMEAIAKTIFDGMESSGFLADPVLPRIPDGEPVSRLYSVTVNGAPAPLWEARVSAVPFNRPWPGRERPVSQTEMAAFLSAELSTPADFTVTAREPVRDAVIRPLSKGVDTEIHGSSVRFTVSEPGQYSLEINGRHHNIHLFLEPPENKRPDPASYTYYFGPGVHEAGTILLGSGDSLYIAAGAVVHGAVRATDAENLHIEGRGILDHSRMSRHDPLRWEEDGIVNLVRCSNVTVEGIILRDSSWWTITSFNCEGLLFRNLKTIGMWRYNSDGFDFVNCRNIHVDGCFLRNFDDVIVFKGLRLSEMEEGYRNHRELLPYEQVSPQNLLIENCVLWCDWGGALEIGAETVADEFCNIVYRNCDIIHVATGAMRIQSGDRAYIHNVLYEDIRVEYSKYDMPSVLQDSDDMKYEPPEGFCVTPVIYCWMYCGRWTKNGIPGNVRDVIYRSISVFTDPGMPEPAIRLESINEKHKFDRITIDGFTLNGRPFLPRLEVSEFTKDLRIGNDGAGDLQ